MLQSLYSMGVAVLTGTMIETSGGEFSIPLMFSVFLAIEVMLREKTNLEGLKWADEPTKKWVNVQTFRELNHILFSGSVMLIGIKMVFNPETKYLEGQYIMAFAIIATLYGYLEFAHRRRLSKKDHTGFERLDKLGIQGTHYILPAWNKLPEETKNQLLAAQYEKIPQKRETHLFVDRRFRKTIVRLISPGGYRPDKEAISPALLEKLEKYPTEKAVVTIDDQLILVRV